MATFLADIIIGNLHLVMLSPHALAYFEAVNHLRSNILRHLAMECCLVEVVFFVAAA